jgi:hypothetical protein
MQLVVMVTTTTTTMVTLVSLPEKCRLNCGGNLVGGIGSPEKKILNIPLNTE